MTESVARIWGRGHRSARCPECRLVCAQCICQAITPLSVRTRVVLVVHRNERLKSSNTARLAARLLAGSALVVRGLRSDERDGDGSDDVPTGRRLLLFPGSHARELTRADADAPPGTNAEPPVLLVPDGSWSQARKLVQRDVLLVSGEPVRLPSVGSSRYRLRRNVRPGTLCTLEAVAAALAILEGPEVEATMLEAFETFQRRSLELRCLPT